MALSEEEQQLLDQMEAALRKEDPTLANRLSGSTPRRLRRRRATIAGIGFIVGLGLLVGGLEWTPVLSIIGFIAMLGSTVVAITAWNSPAPRSESISDDRRTSDVRSDRGSQQRQRRAGGDNKNFMDRMEERWRRRQEDGF